MARGRLLDPRIPSRAAPVLAALLSGCCQLARWETPADIVEWQSLDPPTKSLAEKAALYQSRLEAHHQTPEGLIRYRRVVVDTDDPSYGDLGDGCFHTGIYLASQALRLAATGDPAARDQVIRTLGALEILMAVTGKRGLLARHFTPHGTVMEEWPRSRTLPRYDWKPDVSKDQYAGFVHGLGVAFALVDDPALRGKVAALAAAAADHLMENDLRIVDADGRPTTYGNLSGRFAGVFPMGINALIVLSISKLAAVSAGAEPYTGFYSRLTGRGYASVAHWAYMAPLGINNGVNENMGYLALYPLLLLEKDPRILERLKDGERRTWYHVREERNAFFAFVHAGAVEGGAGGDARSAAEAARAGRDALREFPESKIELPVDLTRPGFDYPRAFLNSRKCLPRTTSALPLYLRPRSSSMWASDPYRLAGSLTRRGERENAGMDYLLAYWMGRYHGFIAPED